MSEYVIIEKDELQNIADNIRRISGTTDLINASELNLKLETEIVKIENDKDTVTINITGNTDNNVYYVDASGTVCSTTAGGCVVEAVGGILLMHETRLDFTLTSGKAYLVNNFVNGKVAICTKDGTTISVVGSGGSND